MKVIRILNIKSHSSFWRSVIYSLQPVFEHHLKRFGLFMGTLYSQNDLKLGIARHMLAYHNRAEMQPQYENQPASGHIFLYKS
jgi:hypothetical protein